MLSNGPSGAMLFTNVGLLLSCIFLKSRLYIESRYTFSLVCAGSVLFESFCFSCSLSGKGGDKEYLNVLLYSIPDAIVTGFVSLFMFGLFSDSRSVMREEYDHAAGFPSRPRKEVQVVQTRPRLSP